MTDLERTKHYTTKAQEVCANLTHYIPNNTILIEPFVGDGDLLSLFPEAQWELYDIEEKNINIIQDTLKNPPSYKEKWVITNPPYLAKNKATDKSVFNQYKTDDLYKASLLSMLDASGGIVIIPTNFFTDEKTIDIRKKFFKIFNIVEVNIFTKPVFETTTYSVCSFAFQRKKQEQDEVQTILFNIKPINQQITVQLEPQYGYQLAGEFYHKVSNTKNIFSRLIGNSSNDFITKIKLYALDTRTERIRLEYEPIPFEGKSTDRTYATFTSLIELTEEQQKTLINAFNTTLENFRKSYCDLSLTNYRDYNRKRIGFTFAYQLLSYLYHKLYG